MTLPAPDLPRFPSRVRSRVGGGGGLFVISIDATAVAASYTTPGQYAWIDAGAGGGYFVLAGRARDALWDVIVQRGGDAADALATAEPGHELRITQAIGHGFPCDSMRGREICVAVPTSAIAVARSVILRRIDEGDAKRTSLLVGARERGDVGLSEELERCREAGVAVTVCLSRERVGSLPGYESGYVQDVARRLFGDRLPVFFVAGATKVETGVRSLAGAEVHSNY
jgi:NAD(P)H-flavin reductase